MRNPLVSIIVPVYNAENTLEKCVDSICRQTYNNLEIILVNDGSKDKSLEKINRIANNDKRIIVIDKKNSGVSETRNLGIEAATGDFISFVDSDDYIDLELYDSLLQLALSHKAEVVALINYTIFPNIIPVNMEILSGKKAQQELLRLRFPTSCWAYLYSKKIITSTSVRFNNEIAFFEDLLFNFTILESVGRVVLCRNNMYHYILNDNSINKSPLNKKKMSALDIRLNISVDNEKLYNAETFFRAHTIISLLLSTMKNKVNKNQRLQEIGKASRCLLKRKHAYFNVPIHYIIIIILTSISPKFAVNMGRCIKYRGGKND